MQELMVALMVWLNSYTGLPIPSEPPRVVFAEPCAVHRAALGDGSIPCPDPADPKARRVVAFYEHTRDTVTLPDTWDNKSLYDVSALLHELVHHMQSHSGDFVAARKQGCVPRLEGPAYDAQIAWLKAAGVEDPVEDLMGLSGLTIMLLQQCPHQVHR